MNEQFKRILGLVKRTGDRMVVTDPDGENVYVMMGLDQYEQLLEQDAHLDTYEDEAFDDEDFEPQVASEEPPKNIFEAMSPAGSNRETWNAAELSKKEIQKVQKFVGQDNVSVSEPKEQPHPPDQKPVEELPVFSEEKSVKNDDFSEEQFYLEPIE